MVVLVGGAVSHERGTPVRQLGPESGLGVQVKVLKTLKVVPSSLDSGPVIEAPRVGSVQGYLAYKKQRFPRTLQ